MKQTFNIADALSSDKLLGAALGDIETWGVWVAVLKAAFAIKLTADERVAFASVAGDREPPTAPVSELWAVAGRRSGKSRMAAALACFIALFVDHSAKLAKGEQGFILTIAPTQKQARLVFDYARAFIEASPIMAKQIDRILADEIRLVGGITIGTHPCSFRSIRGRTLLACIFDESAYWRDESSAVPDLEVYRSVLPALASTGGALIGISSPYRRAGLLYEKHRDNFGQDNHDVLVVQGASLTFNPRLSARIIAAARKADPEAARAEWDAEFRSDLSSLFDDDLIEASIDRDRPPELPRVGGQKYFAFTDASAGRHDAFTCSISHKDKVNDAIVIDVVRGFHPPFDPSSAASSFAALAKSYGCREIVGDNFAGEWVSQAFTKAGITYKRAEANRSTIYLECLPLFSRGTVRLPDHPKLIRELRLLERSTSRMGRDSVDHPRGGSDDFANAACGALWLAAEEKKLGVCHTGYAMGGGDGPVHWDDDRPRPIYHIEGQF